jgi:hypothetical protein
LLSLSFAVIDKFSPVEMSKQALEQFEESKGVLQNNSYGTSFLKRVTG